MGCCFSDQSLYSALHSVQKWAMMVFKCIMKIVGPLFNAAAMLLIFGIAFVYFLFIFPIIIKDSFVKFAFHFTFASLIVTNIFFNLISCSMTVPGSPASIKDPGKVLGLTINPRHSNQPISFSLKKKCLLARGVYYKYCKQCRAVKPPRAHHCSVTGRCVFEMDHYCPWMNNCVGFYNYKYFVLFLANLFVGCLYFMAVIGSEIITLTSKQDRVRLYGPKFPVEIVALTFVVTLGAGISVGLLLAWHIFLVVTNQTTIEFYVNIENKLEARNENCEYKNPFDQGFRKNIARLLGNVPWYYLFFPVPNEPQCPLYPLQVMPGVLTDPSTQV